MQWLVGQMLTCLLGAAFLGVIIGWAWWGLRLSKARERATDFEQRAAKLSGYPARLTDLEGTHSAYVASKNEEEAKFKSRIAELEPAAAKVPELEKSVAAKTAEVTFKAGELAALQTKFNDLDLQHRSALSSAQGVTARVGEMEGLLKTKDTEIAEHVQAHQDKDARLGTLSGRLAELEPIAKKVPTLESQLAQHVDANKEKDEHLEHVMAQVDELKAGHAEKDSRIAELLPLAALVPALKAEVDGHVAAHAEKDAQIAHLNTQVEQRTAGLAEQDTHIDDLAAQVDQHLTAITDKDAQIDHLTSQVDEQKAAHAEKDAKIADLAPLAAMVPHLNSHIAQLNSEAVEKDARIGDLAPLAAMVPHLNAHIAQMKVATPSETPEYLAELAAVAALVPALTAEVEQHKAKLTEVAPLAAMVPHLNAHIAQIAGEHQSALAEKDVRIGDLAPLAAMVPHLNAHIAQIAGEHQTALAEKDVRIGDLAPLAAMVPHLNAHIAQLTAAGPIVAHEDVAALQAQLAEKDQHLGALLSRVEELQPVAAQHADLQYEHELTTRKLRMAETGITAHQAEIAKLNDQLLTQAAPLKSMAAVAGAGTATYRFYDVNEGKAPEPVAAPVQDELSKAQSAKDAEIVSLRSKIAELEAAPDPDARRQILFTAKNAEVTNLKGILNSLLQPINQDDVALRAYNYAKERNFQGGSENEDWLRAERDVQHQRLAAAWETTRGGGTMF